MNIPTPNEIRENIKEEDVERIEKLLNTCAFYMKTAIRLGSARWTIDGSNTEVYEKVRDVLKESGWKLTLLSRQCDYDGTSELSLELKEYVK